MFKVYCFCVFLWGLSLVVRASWRWCTGGDRRIVRCWWCGCASECLLVSGLENQATIEAPVWRARGLLFGGSKRLIVDFLRKKKCIIKWFYEFSCFCIFVITSRTHVAFLGFGIQKPVKKNERCAYMTCLPVNPNSLDDNKGSCWILKDFYCSVTNNFTMAVLCGTNT